MRGERLLGRHRRDDKILARVVDAYRRIRNTLRFLLANTSDFDAATDAVPLDQMLEIDRWALARAAQFQAEVLAHYEVYEFHPVVAKLQVFCSEDLGAFYLDILKDRLYTTAPNIARAALGADRAVAAHARDAALDGAVPQLHRRGSMAGVRAGRVAFDLHRDLAGASPRRTRRCSRSGRASAKCATCATRRSRRCASPARSARRCRPSVRITAAAADHALLATLGDDLHFVTITSQAALALGTALAVEVAASGATKCARCWHYRDDVGHDPAHPTICGRCTSNLFGAGEPRTVA